MRALKLAALLIAVSSPLAAKPAAPVNVAAAVAASARSADNVKLDESRKPAEVLKFLGLKPGMHVIDLFGGNAIGRRSSRPRSGPKGHVHDVGADAILQGRQPEGLRGVHGEEPQRVDRRDAVRSAGRCRRTHPTS